MTDHTLTSQAQRLAQVYDYHTRTKHHPHAHARALGYLDWANQPDPRSKMRYIQTRVKYGP